MLELLVVVAIIALLVSILVPSLSRARELAKRSVCATNIHHIYVAMHMYMQGEPCLPPLTRSSDLNIPPEGHEEMTNAQLNVPWSLFPVIYHVDNKGPDTSAYTNFGPLIDGEFISAQSFFCPSQTHPEMQYNTAVNPWPPADPDRLESGQYKSWNHVFASYGRRLGLSNLRFDFVKPSTAIVTDVAMFPFYTQTHHNDEGFNVLTVDGKVIFNDDPWYHQNQADFEHYSFYDAVRHCVDVFDRLDG